MDISEVAKRSGVAASALRFYERKGLIRPLAHGGARRRYAPVVLDQLALIALGQAAGFSLDEIRAMFTPEGQLQIDRARLAARADEIDAMLRGLQALSEGLRHAAACPALDHAACPSFQRLLKAAAQGVLSAPQGRLAPRQARLPPGPSQAHSGPLDEVFSVWQRVRRSRPA
ncbi:helix-turn-helix domain-containing protein [Aquabacterium sp. OR-4]|uniref:helix-turn-helix domain-containing protein n=1 Tax=Aquabacterium sp. OR-4 TaxID=2978127 RepID=UPI0028C80658|nr:helix-turn-helix domain-containing protein [Aquabacterium sp. OR-4]MDT7838658.1 helix-turn-helix domain-containing protein [Aquabacterium sp. OR-4]